MTDWLKTVGRLAIDPANLTGLFNEKPKLPGWIDQQAAQNAQRANQLGAAAPAINENAHDWATYRAEQMGPGKNPYLSPLGAAGLKAAYGTTGVTDDAVRRNRAVVDALPGQQKLLDSQKAALAQQAADLGGVRSAANGQGPSLAAAQARLAQGQNLSAQANMAAQARGGNVAQAMRAASLAGAGAMGQSIGNFGMQRGQEQGAARGLLATGANNVTGQANALTGRGQDLVGLTQGTANGAITQAAIENELRARGIGAVQQAADQFANQAGTQFNANNAANQDYANWLQEQYRISIGVPAGMAGAASTSATAAAQAQAQKSAANTGFLGSVLGAFV